VNHPQKDLLPPGEEPLRTESEAPWAHKAAEACVDPKVFPSLTAYAVSWVNSGGKTKERDCGHQYGQSDFWLPSCAAYNTQLNYSKDKTKW
jgi:hypothetical protein